jgi:hypothetical protein
MTCLAWVEAQFQKLPNFQRQGGCSWCILTYGRYFYMYETFGTLSTLILGSNNLLLPVAYEQGIRCTQQCILSTWFTPYNNENNDNNYQYQQAHSTLGKCLSWVGPLFQCKLFSKDEKYLCLYCSTCWPGFRLRQNLELRSTYRPSSSCRTHGNRSMVSSRFCIQATDSTRTEVSGEKQGGAHCGVAYWLMNGQSEWI